mgnify:CR=1 FL=1
MVITETFRRAINYEIGLDIVASIGPLYRAIADGEAPGFEIARELITFVLHDESPYVHRVPSGGCRVTVTMLTKSGQRLSRTWEASNEAVSESIQKAMEIVT